MYNGFFDKFHIGAYCLAKDCRDEEHVRDVRECGVDLLFLVNNDRALLDLLYKYNVGAVVNGVLPGWFGQDGKNAGTMKATNPPEAYISRSRLFVDHPAIVGIDVGDEPSALDLPYYGEVIELMKKPFTDKLLYLNIYPSYGMLADAGKEQAKRELGTDNYKDYLRAYVDNVSLAYLSFDHYLYSSNLSDFLGDLQDASDVAREYGKHLMIVLQVNSKNPDVFLSIDELRHQAWCSLAYGVRAITWACYSPGWWHNCVLDKDGRKTEQYEKLKKVNAEIRSITDKYISLTHQSAEIVKKSSLTETCGTSISADCDLLIGRFLSTNGADACILVPLKEGGSVTINHLGSENVQRLCHTPEKTFVLNGQNDSVKLTGLPIFMYSE